MILEILDFEDKGNTWEIPFEDVRRFQFASGAARAGLRERSRLETVVHTLNRPLEIACDRDARSDTLSAVEDAEREAGQWVQRRSVARRSGRIDFSTNAGVDALFMETASYMEHYNVAANEARFAAHYARKFHYSENVKAHRIVMAETGLVPYMGTILREARELEGRFSRSRRKEPTNVNKPGLRIGVLMSQSVALERLFMTYMETAQLNSPYRESEVVLLYSSEDVF